MERTDAVQQEYASFLIRMWRAVDLAAAGAATEWQGEVEHIQSGTKRRFESLDVVLDVIRCQVDAAPGEERP